jgi:hypothetical protein
MLISIDAAVLRRLAVVSPHTPHALRDARKARRCASDDVCGQTRPASPARPRRGLRTTLHASILRIKFFTGWPAPRRPSARHPPAAADRPRQIEAAPSNSAVSDSLPRRTCPPPHTPIKTRYVSMLAHNPAYNPQNIPQIWLAMRRIVGAERWRHDAISSQRAVIFGSPSSRPALPRDRSRVCRVVDRRSQPGGPILARL